MSCMETGERAVSPRRMAAMAWLTTLAVLAWVRFSLSQFDGGWGSALLGVLTIVAVGVPLVLIRGTREVGAGLCVGALGGLILAGVVALAV